MILLQADASTFLERTTQALLEQGTHLAFVLLKALIIFIVGRIFIKLIKKLVNRVLSKRNIAPAVKTFITSLINIVLIVLLIISVIGALGIQTTSFAALIASAGVGIGMALSGNLSNFAGGIIILLFKPFRIGDFIATKDIKGTVLEIQIFHTILRTSDNIRVFIPNGDLSSGYINNYNVDKRRVEWIFGIDYGEDYDKVKKVILDVLAQESRILPAPTPFIELHKLDDSSVNIIVRVWAEGSNFWGVYFSINQKIYKTFNELGINFPYPQLTIHQENN